MIPVRSQRGRHNLPRLMDVKGVYTATSLGGAPVIVPLHCNSSADATHATFDTSSFPRRRCLRHYQAGLGAFCIGVMCWTRHDDPGLRGIQNKKQATAVYSVWLQIIVLASIDSQIFVGRTQRLPKATAENHNPLHSQPGYPAEQRLWHRALGPRDLKGPGQKSRATPKFKRPLAGFPASLFHV